MTPPDPSRTVAGRSLPPLSKRVILVAAVVLSLTIAAIVLDRRSDRTGELLVQSDESDVRVTIKQQGRVVVPESDKRSFILLFGVYDVAATSGTTLLRVAPPRVDVPRSGRVVARVERQP
jgi:hypothetical protein